MTSIELIFWILASLIVYTYVGYALVLFAMVKIKSLFVSNVRTEASEELPTLTLVVPCFNEIDFLDDKVQNSDALDYPKDKLKLIFVTDGSDDGSEKYLEKYPHLTIYHSPVRAGKIAAINRVMPFVSTDIVVYTDANAILNIAALRNIARYFEHPDVGCVAGEKRIYQNEKDKASNAGEGLYWKYESTLKRWSSELYSTVGAAGELFAIRTNLYEDTELDVILDDFMLSLSVVAKGYKIAYAHDAFAQETGSADIKEEMKRKVRICAGGIQSILRTLPLLNPFNKPLFAFQYFSHRFLRWTFTPLALLFMIPVNIYLGIYVGGLYTVLLILHALFYLAGLGGLMLKRRQLKNKFLFVPFYFLMMNISALLGAKRYFMGTQSVLWEKTKRLEVA
jgi:cellulose synthase/poly-beta-1,6-N-acetylglucosamine synthase-like glycosyltransferase